MKKQGLPPSFSSPWIFLPLLVTDYEVQSIWVRYPGWFYLLFSFVFLSWVILFYLLVYDCYFVVLDM